ncbi:hypothetical protein DSO57_1000394 [Entomophthora muscae]|uniref:Uncharacterized protein n=1 Tax=Entomophthora muscae TaxID=34485 RepID=A0ACC2UIA5_9FUNG|nr:hypothetical protein DSO57_1000394 [Entomophthora muscae]
MPSLSSLGKLNSVPLEALKLSPPAPSCAPWLITGLVLMGLNSYFPRLSPASSLWSPLRVVVPVLHWATSWWFVLPGWEPNLVSSAPLSHKFMHLLENIPSCAQDIFATSENVVRSLTCDNLEPSALNSFPPMTPSPAPFPLEIPNSQAPKEYLVGQELGTKRAPWLLGGMLLMGLDSVREPTLIVWLASVWELAGCGLGGQGPPKDWC